MKGAENMDLVGETRAQREPSGPSNLDKNMINDYMKKQQQKKALLTTKKSNTDIPFEDLFIGS